MRLLSLQLRTGRAPEYVQAECDARFPHRYQHCALLQASGMKPQIRYVRRIRLQKHDPKGSLNARTFCTAKSEYCGRENKVCARLERDQNWIYNSALTKAGMNVNTELK